MTRLISLALSLSLLFGSGAAPNSTTVTANVPVTVRAQQAVYGKYECITGSRFYYEEKSTFQKYYASTGDKATGYLEYTFDRATGQFRTIGNTSEMRVGDITEGVVGSYQLYNGSGDSLIHLQQGTVGYNAVINQYKLTSVKKTETIYSRSSYLDDVIADNNSLPADGRHSDGYWYVFKNLVED